MLRSLVHSTLTAFLVSVAVYAVTAGVLGPALPRVVGRPDIAEHRRFELGPVERVRIANPNGTVRVYTHEQNAVIVEAAIDLYVARRDRVEGLRDRLDAIVTCRTDASSGLVETRTEDDPAILDLRVDYTVHIGKGTGLDVSGENGNVWVSAGCGAVTVRGGNTDVEIDRPGGPVDAETVNGRIRVLDAPQGARLRTVNGNVYAHLLGGALDAETANGTIVARLLRPGIPSCKLSTRNGGIVAVTARGFDCTIKAQTAQGAIQCGIPLNRRSGAESRHVLEGTVGSGVSQLQLDTLNGNIVLTEGSTP